jgi:hypothetical protein
MDGEGVWSDRPSNVLILSGMTIASMIASESMRISFSDAPTGPWGSSTPPQPARGKASAGVAKMTVLPEPP